MRYLLSRTPVQLARAGAADDDRVVAGVGEKGSLERNVVVARARWPQVWQGYRVLHGADASKRLERILEHDPRRYARREALGEKRAEWLVLPALDVARRPIV